MSTPENPMVIGALLIFDQHLEIEALEEVVRSKLVPHGRFHQHVIEPPHWFTRPSWRDDATFDLREHVLQLNPSDAVDIAALARLAGERMSTPLPRDRSPWSLELVDLADNGSAIIARIHHCISDGRALVALLEELTDGLSAQESTALTRRPSVRTDGRSGGWLAQVGALSRLFTLSADPIGLFRRPLGGQKVVAWSESISIDLIRSIARVRGHHVTDVLLAGVAGALDRYAGTQGRAPRHLRALLPVAASEDASDDRLGNHYASVFVRLPIAATAPSERLEVIAREMAVVRRGAEPRMAIGVMRIAGAVAPAIERWAVRRWARRASLVVSTLPGPSVPVSFANRSLRSIVVWAPAAASVGLSITFFGYAGDLRLGVLADLAAVERPEELVTEFRASIDELRRGSPVSSP
jgi:hypothetical protein